MKSVFSFQFSIFNYFLLIIAIFGMSACRTQKKTPAPAPAPDEAAFYTSCYPFESIYIPSCKIDLTFDGSNYSLNGSIYIRSDSVCFFRARLLIEVVRGAIYRDSFILVNYLERVVYKGKNDYLQRITGFPVSPESLMMLFTADRCEEVYRNKFNFVPAGRSDHQLRMQGKNRSLLEMNINASNHTTQNIVMHNDQQRFSVAYGAYEQFPKFILPTAFDISAIDIKMKINFQQILFNQQQEMNISVPSRFAVERWGD